MPPSTRQRKVLNRYSRRVTEVLAQGHSQAMLYATGMTEADMHKPQVGICSVWYEGNPCNMHLRSLGDEVKKGVTAAGLVGMQFATVGVSDGISMGTDGMSYSLQSRDLIADSIETIMGAQWYDALVALPGCDKNMPGCIIAMGRLNRPAIMVYGGTIRAGCVNGKKLDIVSSLEVYGQLINDKVTRSERDSVVRHACPGAGACGGMYTANTMASAIEALGMSLPYSASIPAEDPRKIEECHQAGEAVLNLLKRDIKPRDIMTRAAFENAMVVVMALGGSTNSVLHLIAMAKSVGVKLSIDDFQKVSDRVPFLADLKPSGQFVMEDLHRVGGTSGVMKYLLKHKLLDGSCLTCTGKTLAQNLRPLADLDPRQSIVAPLENPIKPSGHITIMYGNLCPGGAVAKITGKEGLVFNGVARCFDCEEDMLKGVEQGKVKKGDVVIIRYEGPKGGPGMPEMLLPTGVIMGAGLGKHVALLTDGRFSGGSHGFIVGHITPEAQDGGPIALVQDGDAITIDSQSRKITLHVTAAEIARRRKKWKMPAYKATNGTLWKYIQLVKTASEGCVTDE